RRVAGKLQVAATRPGNLDDEGEGFLEEPLEVVAVAPEIEERAIEIALAADLIGRVAFGLSGGSRHGGASYANATEERKRSSAPCSKKQNFGRPRVLFSGHGAAWERGARAGRRGANVFGKSRGMAQLYDRACTRARGGRARAWHRRCSRRTRRCC